MNAARHQFKSLSGTDTTLGLTPNVTSPRRWNPLNRWSALPSAREAAHVVATKDAPVTEAGVYSFLTSIFHDVFRRDDPY